MRDHLSLRTVYFNASGIPQKLKEAIQSKSNLKSGSHGFFPHLNDKLDHWYHGNHSLILKNVPDFKFSETDHVADQKSLKRWWGEENEQNEVHTIIDNLNLLCLYAVQKTWIEFAEDLTETELNISFEKVSKRRDNTKEIGYFKRYLETMEKPFKYDGEIDYTRSFQLLLFMFGNESFEQFRAFDMAFVRWKELINETEKGDNTSQIKNIPKDIMHETEFLCMRRQCQNFRRILVLPEIKVISDTKTTLSVLRRFEESEAKVKLTTPDVIFETKVLLCSAGNQYNVDFDQLRDFAMFSNDPDEFAIVETSLTNPYDESPTRICKLITNKAELKRKKERFDFLWEHHAMSISEIITEYSSYEGKSETILEVVNYLDKIISETNHPSIIIETAYVGLMDKEENKKRISHYDSSFEIIKSLSSAPFFDRIKENIFLDAFVNDFSKEECIENCPPDGIQKESSFKVLKQIISKELMKLNLSHCVKPENVNNYFMTNTRNKVTKRFKKFMHDVKKLNSFEYEETNVNTSNIFVRDRNDNKIYVGYKKGGAIIPNCVLIMAEHYYELVEDAYLKNPAQKEYCIIDFLQHYEIQACEQGVEVAFKFFPKKNINVHVINCNYSDNRYLGIKHLGPYNF